MKNLKRYLTSFLKSNANVYRYIVNGIILVAVVVIVRCEAQKRVEAEIKLLETEKKIEQKNREKEVLDFQYDSLLQLHKISKVELDGVKVENNLLRDTLNIMRPSIRRMSSNELKRLFSEYKKRYHLPNNR